jgi:hypothetical protein
MTLKDEQALALSMEEGKGPVSREYVIDKIRRFSTENGAIWHFFHCPEVDEEIWFCAFEFDGQVDFRVYYAMPGFDPGNRKDMFDRGWLWLFQPPANPQNYSLKELAFTEWMDITINTDEKTETVRYLSVGPSVYMLMTESVNQRQDAPIISGITEFKAEGQAENPLATLWEIGGNGNDDGGVIDLLLGVTVVTSDFEVLPV